MVEPSRGEIWLVDLSPVRGPERQGTRPGLAVSVDDLNHGPARLAVVVPITTKAKGIPFHVVVPAQGRAPLDYLTEVLTARGKLLPLPIERSPPVTQPT